QKEHKCALERGTAQHIACQVYERNFFQFAPRTSQKTSSLTCSAKPRRVRIELCPKFAPVEVAPCFSIQRRERVMIHHSCDLCKREIEPEQDVRYVVKIEVYAALDPALDETDDDRDGLAEVQEMLARMEEAGGDELAEDDVYQQLRFDLCPECRKRF